MIIRIPTLFIPDRVRGWALDGARHLLPVRPVLSYPIRRIKTPAMVARPQAAATSGVARAPNVRATIGGR